jgi:hypothetical protein
VTSGNDRRAFQPPPELEGLLTVNRPISEMERAAHALALHRWIARWLNAHRPTAIQAAREAYRRALVDGDPAALATPEEIRALRDSARLERGDLGDHEAPSLAEVRGILRDTANIVSDEATDEATDEAPAPAAAPVKAGEDDRRLHEIADVLMRVANEPGYFEATPRGAALIAAAEIHALYHGENWQRERDMAAIAPAPSSGERERLVAVSAGHEAVKKTERGLAVWSVPRVWAAARDLPVSAADFSEHPVLDSHAWGASLTVREAIEHARRIQAADLSYPVILASDGRVFDGVHRIARAMLEGRSMLPVQRFTQDPEPDRYEPRATPTPSPDAREVLRLELDEDAANVLQQALGKYTGPYAREAVLTDREVAREGAMMATSERIRAQVEAWLWERYEAAALNGGADAR